MKVRAFSLYYQDKVSQNEAKKEKTYYGQRPIEINAFVRKRKVYLFPNMEDYLVIGNPDGTCTIKAKP